MEPAEARWAWELAETEWWDTLAAVGPGAWSVSGRVPAGRSPSATCTPRTSTPVETRTPRSSPSTYTTFRTPDHTNTDLI